MSVSYFVGRGRIAMAELPKDHTCRGTEISTITFRQDPHLKGRDLRKCYGNLSD